MLDFSTIQAYPSSNTFVAKANSISAFTEIIPGLKYTIRRGIITSRFIVGFTIEKPKSGVSTYSDSVRDDSAESISVIAPEGAKYIYGYVFNPSYDSVDTRDSVIQSIQIIASSSVDIAARNDIESINKEMDSSNIILNDMEYGIPPYMLSIFKKSENMFSNFCNHIEKSYYGNNGTNMLIKAATGWQGWFIRVKPNTTYTIGPVDYEVAFFTPELLLEKKLSTSYLSDTTSSLIISGPNSYWMSLTQKLTRDMSEWMMVEGETYPETYISGEPEFAYPINTEEIKSREAHYSIFFQGNPITVTFNRDGSCDLHIPSGGRVLSKTTPTSYLPSADLSFSNAKWISYNKTKGEWVTTNAEVGDINYTIGWINPNNKLVYLNAYYKILGTKTIAFMGDSITAGVAAEKCYHEFIHDMYGYTCLNYGFGGSGYYRNSASPTSGRQGTGVPGMGVATNSNNFFTPNNIVARLAELNVNDIDGIVIFAGTNDYGNGVSIQDYISGIEQAFEYCKTNFTKCPVLVMTPIRRANDTNPNSQGKTLRDYVDVLIDECIKYSIAYVDTMTMSGLYPDNIENRTLYFPSNPDSGLHPGKEGHKRIACAIGETLKALNMYTELA